MVSELGNIDKLEEMGQQLAELRQKKSYTETGAERFFTMGRE